MPDAPFTTGNDLLQYQGNANLGYGGGVQYNYDPTVKDPLAPLNQSLEESLKRTSDFNNLVYQNAQQQKRLEYGGGVQRQDNMFKYLTETGKSLFNQKDANGNDMSLAPIPEDQKYLQGKIKEGVHPGVFGNPVGYQYDPNVISNVNNVLTLNKIAQSRALNKQMWQQQLLSTQDPDEQQRIKDHIKTEIDDHTLADGYVPKPLVPNPAYSWNTFHDAKELQDPKNLEDFNGQVGVKLNIGDNRDELRADKTKMAQAKLWMQQQIPAYIQNPDMIKNVDFHNQQVNQQLGLKPSDPHYVPSFEQALKSGDPANVIYALHGANILQRAKSDKTAPDEAADALKEAETNYKIEQTKHLGDKEEKPLTPQQIADQHETELVVNRVRDIFNRQYAANQGAAIDGPGVIQALRAKGYNPKDWEAFALPKGADVSDLNGIERIVTNDKGVEQRTGETERADNVMMLKNTKTGDVKLASFKKNPEKDGDPAILISMVGPREAVGNAAKSKHQYKGENARLSEEISRNEAELDKAKEKGVISERPTTSSDFEPKYNGAPVQIKLDGGVKKALVGGLWKKIIARNSKTGEIKVE